jgi:tRNA/rRNA methyltransferase
MSLDLCRVVLVETHYAGNIGATARIMRNMGVRKLVLVNPIADPGDRQAQQMSTQGDPLLRDARIVTTFDDAVADCVLVAGTSARTGGPVRRQSVGTPEAIMPAVVDVLRRGQLAALVFGPEPNGLDDETITRCHYLIRIPTGDEYPSLNLAQAVAICLYELGKAAAVGDPAGVATVPGDAGSVTHQEIASFAEQEQMFSQLRTALHEIHFLYGDKADPLMHAVRHLLGRARPSIMEVKVLLGLARQIRWYVANHPSKTGEGV